MEHAQIYDTTMRILSSIPPHVTLVAAGKTRSPQQLEAVIQAGVKIIGHNYVQEAQASIEQIGRRIKWHCIGHVQSNKIKKAAKLFDLIETIDNLKTAHALNHACRAIDKHMPVFIEINSCEETAKSGVSASQAIELIREVAKLDHLRIQGLMTMGAYFEDPKHYRPAFRLTRQLFEHIRSLDIHGVEMLHVSMGMSDSYQIAIEEGATMVRIGSLLFGPR